MEHALELMARRGPDASGLWTDGDACMLAFRRLSILDLSEAGNQPMLTRDGRYALVFNGELYNFREIARRLRERGVVFRSTGDAEVVLYALAEYGVRALAEFNGMFALAFYDTLARTLLVARDHAGIKPLYVLRDREGVLFASQYDQILSHPWARAHKISDSALSLYLNLGYLPPPYALLEGTSTVEPGTWMLFGADGVVRQGRYFELPRFREPELRGRAAHEAVDAAVTAAVQRQMVSDVPVGVFLSGGIDSPLIAAKAQALTGGGALPAFTLGTGGDEHDESTDAARYAEGLGVRHIVEHITHDDVLTLLDDVVTAYSEPHDDYSIFPTFAVSRLARQHVTVALSGDGGDDIFWGYPGRMVAPLRRRPGAVISRLAGVARAALRPNGTSGNGSKPNVGTEALRRHRFVAMRGLAAMFPEMPSLPADFTLYDFDGHGVDETAQWLRWNEYSGHLVRVLQKVDRASMHCSLEVRVPLLDREVVDVATRVDWKSCVDLRRTVGKLPLRAALRRHVSFQTVPKRGFSVPMSSWLRGPLRPLIEDLVLSRTEMLGLPLHQGALHDHVRRHRVGVEGSPWLMWRLLSLALWESRHYRAVPQHA